MTRALLRINNGEEYSYFYVNHDGYPDGLGKTLLGYLQERFGKKDWIYGQIKADVRNDKIKNFSFVDSDNDLSFIDYLYILDCNEKELKCFNGYHRGKTLEDYCQPKNQERIPVPEYHIVGCPPKYINESSFIEELMKAVDTTQCELEQYVQYHEEDINEDNINYEELKEYAVGLATVVSRVRELIEKERNKHLRDE